MGVIVDQLVLGRFLVVLGSSWRFLAVLGGAWLFLAVLGLLALQKGCGGGAAGVLKYQ